MPSWLPGDDYMTNFKVGDPFVQIDDGYARLIPAMKRFTPS